MLVYIDPEGGIQSVHRKLMPTYEERQNFDPSGHYARPDVTYLTVNRQRTIKLVD